MVTLFLILMSPRVGPSKTVIFNRLNTMRFVIQELIIYVCIFLNHRSITFSLLICRILKFLQHF